MVACLSFVLAAFIAVAAGQSSAIVAPTNATLSTDTASSEITMSINSGTDTGRTFTIAPLTAQSGLGQSSTGISTINISGVLVVIDPSNASNATSSVIAYISCDPNTATSNLDPSAVAQQAAESLPMAILFYSKTAESCNFTGTIGFTTLYTMTSKGDSDLLETVVQATFPEATIRGNGTSTTPGGPAPTTAVAMSILYSITGIITLLFLIIIATGAIRAHRHPERYGPRGGFPGRPRQSRAKGLARAMLETLPIVKFGDPEPVKPPARDIEMEDGSATLDSASDGSAGRPGTGISSKEHSRTNTGHSNGSTPDMRMQSGLGVATPVGSTHSGEASRETDLGCSICTEDFTTGEDVRVLPCNHKYHPACIDPWLLNVSGTCPLCRHDLRPENSQAEGAGNDDLAPPLANTENPVDGDEPQRRRASRFLDLHRLRHAPADERIAALRNLREQSRREGNDAVVTSEPASEETSRRTRLTARLRETLRIKTRSETVPEAV